MRSPYWIAVLWPGFAQAWVLARWSGLALAAAFAGCLNSAIFATYRWAEGGDSYASLATLAWILVAGLWIAGAVWLQQDAPLLGWRGSRKDPQAETWFREAQHEYLKGHWLEAEALLQRVAARRTSDPAAELLLASVQRRSGRWNDAKRTLVTMKTNAASAAWLFEIESELKLIAELENETKRSEEVAIERSPLARAA